MILKHRMIQFVGHEDLKLLGWNKYRSILSNYADRDRFTKIFALLLISVPTNDFIAIVSALRCPHNILAWAKTVISLNLYLFEVYLLVLTQLDLKESYMLRLGELLILFVTFAIS